MKQSNGLKVGMVVIREYNERILIVSPTSHQWILPNTNGLADGTIYDKENLTTTWNYRNSGWRLDEGSVVDQVLNKYLNG